MSASGHLQLRASKCFALASAHASMLSSLCGPSTGKCSSPSLWHLPVHIPHYILQARSKKPLLCSGMWQTLLSFANMSVMFPVDLVPGILCIRSQPLLAVIMNKRAEKRCVCRLLMDRSLGLDDLRDVHPEIYDSLKKLLIYDGNVEDMGLFFQVNMCMCAPPSASFKHSVG